jgi:tRNA(fMet)-specific endonuclease VapC
MVILDTNIIIDHLRTISKQTDSKLVNLAKNQPKTSLALSTISIQELFEGQSTKSTSKLKDLLAIISPLKILPYTYDIAMLAGQIARDLPQPIEFADAAIAATAITHNAQLYTLNQKHFHQIPHLSLLKPTQSTNQ